MEEKNILERLSEVNPEAEIWWDSSPLIYSYWVEEVLKRTPEEKKEVVQNQYKRLYNPELEKTLFIGVTTNPPLIWDMIERMESYGDPYCKNILNDLMDKNPKADEETLTWIFYKEILKQAAQKYLGIFQKSDHKYGFVCGQVDSRNGNVHDEKKMLEQAEDLAKLSPNMMIKIPGTKEGYRVIKILTSKGIATNNTFAFVLPQLIAGANAVREGLEIARNEGVNLTRWRSVITFMSARYGELGYLKKEAEERGIKLSEADVRWAEIAIFKKAYKIFKERDYPSKLLICSMRIGPPSDGERNACWHLEKLAGANIVYTCPPKFIELLMKIGDTIRFRHQIDEEVPEDVLHKLLRIPYFQMAYAEDGLTADEFGTHPPFLATAKAFGDGFQNIVNFVAKILRERRR